VAGGGSLAGFRSAAEQADVEQYFSRDAKVMLAAHTYIGVVLANFKWMLLDGTFVGQGYPSDSPYAHW
jgi:hypothetical protein